MTSGYRDVVMRPSWPAGQPSSSARYAGHSGPWVTNRRTCVRASVHAMASACPGAAPVTLLGPA